MKLSAILATLAPKSQITFQIGKFKDGVWKNKSLESPQPLDPGKRFSAFVPIDIIDEDLPFLDYCTVVTSTECEDRDGNRKVRLTCVRN